jgi:hypothetical protein
LTLLGRLQNAEAECDYARRQEFCATARAMREVDKALWSQIGAAIGSMARQVRDSCAASAFALERPCAGELAIRRSTSIDDQLDPNAWRVVDAAARLAAERR